MALSCYSCRFKVVNNIYAYATNTPIALTTQLDKG
jgi:hypothetical protein